MDCCSRPLWAFSGDRLGCLAVLNGSSGRPELTCSRQHRLLVVTSALMKALRLQGGVGTVEGIGVKMRVMTICPTSKVWGWRGAEERNAAKWTRQLFHYKWPGCKWEMKSIKNEFNSDWVLFAHQGPRVNGRGSGKKGRSLLNGRQRQHVWLQLCAFNKRFYSKWLVNPIKACGRKLKMLMPCARVGPKRIASCSKC